MTTQQTGGPAGFIPEWTRGDRLRKARTELGLTTREFADTIGVSQKTVTDAENDRRAMRKILLNAWSLATGVPVLWLDKGVLPEQDDRGPEDPTPSTDTHQYPQVTLLRTAA